MLAAAGLPILGRYLLLPAAILAIFCGAGAFGWASLERADPWRRPWAWFALATIVLLVAFVPAQADRLGALRRALARQDTIQADLGALARGPRAAIRPTCAPLTVPNHRPVPLLALWLDVMRRRWSARRSSVRRAGRGSRPPIGRSRATTSSTRAIATGASSRRRRASGRRGRIASWRVLTRCG